MLSTECAKYELLSLPSYSRNVTALHPNMEKQKRGIFCRVLLATFDVSGHMTNSLFLILGEVIEEELYFSALH
jgi:hypothetical protein